MEPTDELLACILTLVTNGVDPGALQAKPASHECKGLLLRVGVSGNLRIS